MIHRHVLRFMTGSLSTIAVLLATGLAVSQEVPKEKPSPFELASQAAKPNPQDDLDDEEAKLKAVVGKMLNQYDLTPHSPTPIPDNPPPHEGAMISLPVVVEPPDMIVVEVLEGLPGRPISGERLLRPDGTITLGFYGDVQVRGLTPSQMQVAIIKRLINYIPVEALGMIKIDWITGEIIRDPKTDAPIMLDPRNSDRVYVDVSAYNTRSYYVLGDVLVTGKLPWTGNETVLDALQYAGGLTYTADPKNIRLVRPARGGKPAKVYKIDYEAILEKGEVTANYQLFPGDRLIVGRNDVVQKTVDIDRLAAPIQSVVGSILQEAYTLRAIQTASPDHVDELYKELVDFWLKQLSSKGDLKFDEQTLRDALSRKLKMNPAPVPTTPAPK
jgi:polysaccharide export outer membrane protein